MHPDEHMYKLSPRRMDAHGHTRGGTRRNHPPVTHLVRDSGCLCSVKARSTDLHTPPLLLQEALGTLDTLLLTRPCEKQILNSMEDEYVTGTKKQGFC